MRNLVFVIPHLITDPNQESIVSRLNARFEAIVERSTVFRMPQETAPHPIEMQLLGLRPGEAQLEEGPLVVAALNVDPPPRSVHFHLALQNVDEDGRLQLTADAPSPGELRVIVEQMSKLNTRVLTLVPGSAFVHGLVWENGSIDLATTRFPDAAKKTVAECEPQGDGEPMLRRLIHDSVNLLDELEFNRIRAEEGKAKLNLLWPWGQGFRNPTPDLGLRWGIRTDIVGSSAGWPGLISERLAGLTRLCGFRFVPYPKGTNWREDLRRIVLRSQSAVVVAESISSLQNLGWVDRAHDWLTAFLDEVILPIAELPKEDPIQLSILAPAEPQTYWPLPERVSKMGLGLRFSNASITASTIPFDERALYDARLGNQTLWQSISSILSEPLSQSAF
ncbi:MAG: hypothetical protein JST40_04490 [Armatimonadetes bacterium]|nr:hypothetical protein [Armatimonadota bacterium]